MSGTGPVLLCDSGWITDLRGQLGLYSFGDFLAGLAARFTVIRYDKPGCGLSDREGGDLSLAGQVSAAMAVADAVGVKRFSVFGASQGGHVAATIAARYPDRVDGLVVYGTCVNGRDLAPAEVRASVVALVRAHWGLGLRVLAKAFVAEPTGEDVEAFHRFQRFSTSGAVAARLLEVYYDTDVGPVLPRIRARTAVLHRVSDTGTPFGLGREVAALIPGATLIPLSGSSHLYYHGQVRQIVVAERFNGPPGSGNGGYVCGTLAALVGGGPVAVRLLRPPRLGVQLSVDGGRLLDGDTVVAEAAAWTDDLPDLPPPVPLADADAATRRFAGYLRHPFPSCFGCGTDRTDGLRIFPGPVAGTTSVAAPWRPGPTLAVAGSIPAPVVWTALDCPGGWAIAGSAVVVLGTMVGQTLRTVSAGEELVVTAAPAGVQGHKRYAVSAVRTATSELVAWSRQTWVEVD